MPVDSPGINPGTSDRKKKKHKIKQCHFNLYISQLYKTFGTMNAKPLKRNQLNFLSSFIYFD